MRGDGTSPQLLRGERATYRMAPGKSAAGSLQLQGAESRSDGAFIAHSFR